MHPPLRKNLLEGNVAAHLRRLSLPLMWGLFAMTAFNVIDTIYISRLGTEALAALGFTVPIVMLFMGVCFGLNVGTTSVLSRAYGEGDHDRLRQLTTDGIVLGTLLVSTAAAVGYFMIDHIFIQMGASSEALPVIHDYMAIWYIGMPFLAIMMLCNAAIRATGDTIFPATMMTLTAVINICLDPFLIFGWGPFPEMGLAGAATTLTVAYILTACTSLWVLARHKKILNPNLFHAGSLAAWRKILYVGVPSIISNIISPISAAIITWLAASLGKEAVAALGISTRIESFAIITFYSLGGGVAIFTGQNYGAGNYGRINDATSIAARYAILWGAGLAVLFWLLSDKIIHLFDTTESVMSYTLQYLYIVPASYGAMGLLVTANASLNAMGKPVPATVFILLRTFALYIPLAYLGEKHYGFQGILYALAFTNTLIGICAFIWCKRSVTS